MYLQFSRDLVTKTPKSKSVTMLRAYYEALIIHSQFSKLGKLLKLVIPSIAVGAYYAFKDPYFYAGKNAARRLLLD